MIIESIYIENFRGIKEQQLNFDNLTVLVGRNGSGKSSFLKGIDIFYDISAPITNEDFFDHDTTKEILIRVTYSKLRQDETQEFQSYIRNDKLIVSKRIKIENEKITQKYYAGSMQIKQFAKIREISIKRDKVAKFKELIDTKTLPNLSGNPRNAEEVDTLMVEYEKAHPELCEPIEKEEQFFGAKTVGGGKLDNYTKFVLIPAVREVSDETNERKGSSLYQLLDLIVYRQINSKKEIIEFKNEIDGKIKKLYSSDKIKELPLLGETITQTLCKFFPGAELKLNWEDIKPPELIPPKAKPTLIEDGFEGDITKKGHGLQRALIITLLQHLALTRIQKERIESEKTSNKNELNREKKIIGPDLILAIEEPELYLHPLRCRYLSNLLRDLSENNDPNLKNQIIYTTHSPFFIDLDRFNQMRLIKKQKLSDDSCSTSKVTQYSLEQFADEIAKISGIDKAQVTVNTSRVHTISIMDSITNEGFFADVVVVVEGLSDTGFLWAMQDIMKKEWTSLGIAIIPARGKNNIDRPVIIFRGFSIPTYFIFDSDFNNKEKDAKQETIRRNKKYLKLAGVQEEDFPSTQVHETWACFKDKIESYIEIELTGSVFNSYRDQIAKELAYDKPSNVLKNIEGADKFIRKTYSEGKKLQHLENIVNKITQLAKGGKKNGKIPS
jgi:predicted ATP-dependent endonuclease of OLD family